MESKMDSSNSSGNLHYCCIHNQFCGGRRCNVFTTRKIFFAASKFNTVKTDRLVIGVVNGNKSKTYPIQFLGYYHFVYGTVNKQPVLVTYCTVCRTGRVYDPRIDGKVAKFRLVGTDHYNAMIENEETKTWW